MYELLEGHGIVPVIKLSNSKEALPLADALSAGGINIMEITFRSDAAIESIKTVGEAYPDILVGAGTVISEDQLLAAKNAGAKFIVSPGFDPELVELALKENLIILPGVVTPTEVTAAMKMGLSILKFFPACNYGGIAALKSLGAPFTKVKFMPTGGVGPNNLRDYLILPNVQACGGSWMVKDELISGNKWEEITRLSQEATDIYNEIKK